MKAISNKYFGVYEDSYIENMAIKYLLHKIKMPFDQFLYLSKEDEKNGIKIDRINYDKNLYRN